MTILKGLRFNLWAPFLFLALSLAACSTKPSEVVELKRFPLDSLDGVLTRSDVTLDAQISSDGKGSLRLAASKPMLFRLFEVEGLHLENSRLIFRAKLRSENLTGEAYLEMWARFPGKGEFFSRSLQQTIKGTTEWVSIETPFFFKKGEQPDLIKLNVAVNGAGTVWVDDIVLVKAGL